MTFVWKRIALRLCAVVLAISSAADLIQFVDVAGGESEEPQALVLEHLASGIIGIVAAVGLWRGARWGGYATVAWGALTALLLSTLTWLLDLPPESQPGLWAAAAGVMAFAILVAWYARPRTVDEPEDSVGR